mmetsp:Transcript_9534/g.23951  ORF Transcript_9534/g.23951 Transcript_9534/m.23951 type:complete len:337 (-) Transcript_9534:13-1023(-)
MNRLVRLERHLLSRYFRPHRSLRQQEALHRAGERIERRVVLEVLDVEVPLQLPIDAVDQVEVELRGHAQRVRVGRDENTRVFKEIQPHKKLVALVQTVANLPQKLRRTRRRIVPERRPQKHHEIPPIRFVPPHPLQRLQIIRHQPMALKPFLPAKPPLHPLHRRPHRHPRNIHRHIPKPHPLLQQLPQQNSRLPPVPDTELDHVEDAGGRAGARVGEDGAGGEGGGGEEVGGDDGGGEGGEDVGLGGDRVVFGEPRDLLVELAAGVVVEVPRGEGLLGLAEAVEDVAAELLAGGRGVLAADDRDLGLGGAARRRGARRRGGGGRGGHGEEGWQWRR